MSQLIEQALLKKNQFDDYQIVSLQIQKINLFKTILEINWPINTTLQRGKEDNFILRMEYHRCYQKNLLFEVEVDESFQIIRVSVIFQTNLQPMFINSKNIKNQILKNLRKINSKSGFGSQSIVTIDKAGIILFKCVKRLMSGLLNSGKFQEIINQTIKNIINKIEFFGQKILDLSNQLPKNAMKIKNFTNRYEPLKEFQERIKQINNYLKVCSLEIDVNQQILDYQNNRLVNQIQIKIKQSKQPHYQYQKLYVIQQKQQNIILSVSAFGKFAEHLRYPSAKQGSCKWDNKYIFNYIKLVNPISIKAKRFRENDISLEKISHLQFYYVSTHEAMLASSFPIPKNKIIKKSLCILYPKKEQFLMNLEHQIKILTILRASASSFLFKYYQSYQSNLEFKNLLLIDAYRYPTLQQYLNDNQHSISFRTKIFLLSQVAHALYFLKDYQIVHMSINEKNIIVKNNLTVKIINFGNSFHHQICREDYRIRSQLPEAAPQLLSPNRREYDSSQDVFSFGVLLFKIIFDRELFEVTPKLYQLYSNCNYFKYIHVSPQLGYLAGERRIIDILINLITKCLNPNPKTRPSPQWLVIILKEIMAHCIKN